MANGVATIPKAFGFEAAILFWYIYKLDCHNVLQ